MDAAEYPEERGADMSPPRFEMMEDLEVELNRYERIINMTAALLTPVILSDEMVKPGGSEPQLAPATPLEAQIIRLRNLNQKLEDLRNRIRL